MACILVIDDEPTVRRLLRSMLERNGYTVLEAQNGKIAINIYKENSVDLLVMDIFMPEKEGLETIVELKKIDPACRIIAISGGGAHSEPTVFLNMAESMGVRKTLMKPITEKELLSSVQEILSGG